MSKNLWDEDDEGAEFLDRPDETRLDNDRRPMQAPPVQVQVTRAQPATPRPSNIPAEPVHVQSAAQKSRFDVDIDLDNIEFEEEEDFSVILNDANLRIEQGRLYQMLMNHDLFDGLDADPRAVQNVQREIRKIARELMETMLGMREKTPAPSAAVANPFNDLEIDILKKIASKATNGATETEEANQVAAVVRQAPKRQTLNPIGGSVSTKRPQTPQPQKQQTRLQSSPAAPIKRSKMDLTIDQICAEEGVPRELLEENYKPLGKSPDQLSEQELVSRAKETARRIASRTTVKSAQALPMASPEQQEALAMARASQVSQGPGMAAILDKVNKMPKSLNVE